MEFAQLQLPHFTSMSVVITIQRTFFFHFLECFEKFHGGDGIMKENFQKIRLCSYHTVDIIYSHYRKAKSNV